MLEQVQFTNYRVLRDATLPFSQCTLLLGPNGSGKSTAISGIAKLAMQLRNGGLSREANNLTLGVRPEEGSSIKLVWKASKCGLNATYDFVHGSQRIEPASQPQTNADFEHAKNLLHRWVQGVRVFNLDPAAIATPVILSPSAEIQPDGGQLPVVLTQLQDQYPERFEAFNNELAQWMPEFDRVLFDTPANGQRGLLLRTIAGKHFVPASDLSHGTLLALCILTLAHLPSPPTLICLEEPDRGIHPRLLRRVHDAMVRLSDPGQFGDVRPPVQVIATTHSPYLLDLFKDHPQDVVLAEKSSNGATFHRLTDMPHYKEIMEDAPLGDSWYTGILGGVPVTS